jgi:outer membrane protein assembly factor BamB
MVICLNATTGASLWTKPYESQTHPLHARSSYASSTPAVDAECVYVAWSTRDTTTLMALDHEGREVWQRDLGRWIGSHGFGASPILYDGQVILHNSLQAESLEPGEEPGDSCMLAVDRRTGEEIWRSSLGSARVCYSTPAIYRPAQGADELICCSTAEGIFSLDPRSGRVNWNTAGAIKMRSVSSPVIAGELILGTTGSGGGGNYLVAIRPAVPREIVYQVRRNAPYVPTPVAHEGMLFLWSDKGIVSCLDLQTGEEHWRERMATGFSGSPIRAGDKVYCISEDGELICVAAAREFYSYGKTRLGEFSHSTPAVHRGRMYLRTDTHMVCIAALDASM